MTTVTYQPYYADFGITDDEYSSKTEGAIFSGKKRGVMPAGENDIKIERDIQRSKVAFPEVIPGSRFPLKGKWVGKIYVPLQQTETLELRYWYVPYDIKDANGTDEVSWNLIPLFSATSGFVKALYKIEIRDSSERYSFPEFDIKTIGAQDAFSSSYFTPSDLPIKITDFSVDGRQLIVSLTKMWLAQSGRSAVQMDDMMYLPDQELVITDSNGTVYATVTRTHYKLYHHDDFDGNLLYPCIGAFQIILDMFRPYDYY